MNTRRINIVLSFFVAVLLVFSGIAPFCSAVLPQAEVAFAATSDVDAYYESIDTSLTGDSFRNNLATLITQTHKKQTSYKQLTSIYDTSDRNPDGGGMLLFYTGTVVSSYSSYGANREHVWPKDGGRAFSASSECGSDAHHLRPCDSQLNSTRQSHSFGEVEQTSSNIVKQNGSTSYENPCYLSGGLFYPGVGYRGATARILMYVQTRWGNQNNLKFVDGAGACKTIGDFDTLYKWHLEEPPTESEKIRNEEVYKIQGNRNPFIDHPEYAYMIYSEKGSYYDSGDSATLANSVQKLTQSNDAYGNLSAAAPTNISVSNVSVEVGKTTKLSVDVVPQNASKKVVWSVNDQSIATVNSDGVVSGIKEGTATVTATSLADSSVKTTATITVTKARTATALSISGSPSKTIYYAGEQFNPAGLTVTVSYDIGEPAEVSLADCEWLDAGSGMPTLSEGTTSVVCRYGGLEKTVDGIRVQKSAQGSNTITIDRSSFSGSGAYAWCNWSADGISGKGYIYPGQPGKIQLNSKKDYKYLFNTTAIGGIKTITVKSNDSNGNWEVRTQNTAYTATSTDYPTSGTSWGTKEVTPDGVTWNITDNSQYFTLNYIGSGVFYLDQIVITFGGESSSDSVKLDKISCSVEVGQEFTLNVTASGDVVWTTSDATVATVTDGKVTALKPGNATITATCGNAKAQCVVTVNPVVCKHVPSDWIADSQATCSSEGSRHIECTLCHTVLQTEKLSKLPHTESEWIVDIEQSCSLEGSKHTECTVCREVMQTEKLPKLPHVKGNEVTVDSTCSVHGEHYVLCSVCNQKITSEELPLAEHTFGQWRTSVPSTCTEEGTQFRKCEVCGEIERQSLPLVEHDYGDWTALDNGMLSHACKNCGHEETKQAPSKNVTEFEKLVAAIAQTETNEDRFLAIKLAASAYNGLSADERRDAQSATDSLNKAITDYNQAANKINTSHNQIVSDAANFFAASISAMAALVFVVKNGLIGR